MNTNDIISLLNTIDIAVVNLIIKMCIAYFVVVILKNIIENISNYVLFKTNPYVSVGRKVIVDGIEGYINKITLGYIIISNDDQDYTIRMSRWKFSKWIFLKNHHHSHTK